LIDRDSYVHSISSKWKYGTNGLFKIQRNQWLEQNTNKTEKATTPHEEATESQAKPTTLVPSIKNDNKIQKRWQNVISIL